MFDFEAWSSRMWEQQKKLMIPVCLKPLPERRDPEHRLMTRSKPRAELRNMGQLQMEDADV